MAVTYEQFFQLLGKSRLLRPDQLERLQSRLLGEHHQKDARPLARKLVMDRVLTRYQATVLLGGRAGPFSYGDYQVFDRVRGGRLAGLFKAVHAPSGHPVLLKFASGEVAQDARQWDLARRFVQTQTDAVHPQLQTVCELVDLKKYRLLALENVSGQSLQDALKHGNKPLPVDEACRLVRLAAMGLGFLHERGLVYGDLRPFNLWLEPNGNVKLLRDKLLPPAVPDMFAEDLEPVQLDRFNYLAPELAHPGATVSPLTDIYALGCTLYELLSGQHPFPNGKPSEKLERHATEAIKPLDSAVVPAALGEVVAYMMAKQTDVRISDAHQIVERLARFLAPDQLSIPPAAPAATQIAYDLAVRQQAAQPGAPPAKVPPPAAAPVPAAAAAAPIGGPATVPQPAAAGVTDRPIPGEIGIQPVDTARSSQTSDRLRRLRQARRNRLRMLMAFAATLIVVGLGILAVSPKARTALFGSGSPERGKQVSQTPETATTKREPEVSATDAGQSAAPAESEGPYELLPDDGQLLWASPTSGAPVALNYVPPGAQVVIILRPADLLASQEGTRVLQALGPAFQQARARWEATVAVKWEQIDQLICTLHDNGQAVPRAAYVIRLRESVAEQAMIGQWGPAEKVVAGEDSYYQVGDRSFYLPQDGGGQVLVVAATEDLQEVIEFGGAEPAMRRELATLLQSSDEDRQATIAFAPSFVFTNLLQDGRSYSFGQGRNIRQPLQWMLRDDLKACLISFQFDDPFYVELRAYGQVNHDTPVLAANLQARLEEVPDLIEAYFQQYYPPAYWRRVALRVPQMVRFLYQQTRVGVEQDQAIVNAALPAAAAHNLAFAAQMLITAPQSELDTGTAAAPPAIDQPQTLKQLLASTMDLSFDQKSLEFAIRDLAVDVKEAHSALPFEFGVKILGGDLQLEGITRNQQITDFTASGQTIADILTSLVMRANPVTTVQDPSEPDQKLIWVVGPDPDMPDRQIVLITTRAAAIRQSYTLPAPFQPEDQN